MLAINTMRYGTDVFSFRRQSLLTSNIPWNTTDQTSINGFTIEGSEPSGSNRRIIFKIDDKLYKFTSGAITEYTYEGELEDILKYGNTVSELTAIRSIPSWINKKIYPIIALDAPADNTIMPTIKISLKMVSENVVYIQEVESAEFELSSSAGAVPRIIEITATDASTGGATTETTVRYKYRTTEGEELWSEYGSLNTAKNQDATAVQFKTKYTVNKLDGTQIAKVGSIIIRHTMGATFVNGEVCELYTAMQNYENDLGSVYAVIKHKDLVDSNIQAFANFAAERKKRVLIDLGVSTGIEGESMILGVGGVPDPGINQNSIQIYVNGNLYSGYNYNVLTSTINLTVAKNSAITASYEYNVEPEKWIEMEKEFTQPYLEDGTYMSRFSLVLDDEDTIDKHISNVKFVLTRDSGTVTNKVLGKGTGVTQMFVLDHPAKKETIQCNGNWSYDDASKIITVIATKDTDIIISYEWIAEQQEVYGFNCGWIPAV